MDRKHRRRVLVAIYWAISLIFVSSVLFLALCGRIIPADEIAETRQREKERQERAAAKLDPDWYGVRPRDLIRWNGSQKLQIVERVEPGRGILLRDLSNSFGISPTYNFLIFTEPTLAKEVTLIQRGDIPTQEYLRALDEFAGQYLDK